MERGTHSDIHDGTMACGSMKMRRGGEGREGALVRSLLTVGMTTTRTSGGGSLGVCGCGSPWVFRRLRCPQATALNINGELLSRSTLSP